MSLSSSSLLPPVYMSNAVCSSRESNPFCRICNQLEVPLGHVGDVTCNMVQPCFVRSQLLHGPTMFCLITVATWSNHVLFDHSCFTGLSLILKVSLDGGKHRQHAVRPTLPHLDN